MNKKEFVIILTFTFIVVMIWIASEVIHARPSPPVNEKIKILIDPIDPNFDATTLSKIKEFKNSQQPLNIVPAASPIPSSPSLNPPIPSPTPTPIPTITPTPSDDGFSNLDFELDQL